MSESIYERLCQAAKDGQELKPFSAERLRQFAELTRVAAATYQQVQTYIGAPAGRVCCSPPHARSFTVRFPDILAAHEIHPTTGVLKYGLSVELQVDGESLYVGVWVLVFHDAEGCIIVQVEDNDATFPAHSATGLESFSEHVIHVILGRLGLPVSGKT